MPELPEVETIRRQLNEELVGKKILKIEVLRAKSFQGNSEDLTGWEIEKVGRKAKVIEVYFRGRSEMILIHLKMTGQLVFIEKDKRVVGGHPTADWVKELPSKHTRVIISFKDGSKLFFNDLRVFGWIKLIEVKKYLEEMRKTTPDVTDKEFSFEYLSNILSKSKKPVKLLLMDQEKVGGVGNIYANDALYLAGILPTRKADSLTERETRGLLASVREVIHNGIKYGGASAANYVDTKGMGGTYQEHFLVYKKDGQKCRKCGSLIKKMKVGGRGTFFCADCQK